MEEAKSLLHDLREKFKSPIERQILVSLNNQRKVERLKMESVTKALQENVLLFKKKNMQLEGEIRRYSYIHGKKNDTFVEINNEKLRLAKRVVELEDEGEKIKASIHEVDRSIQEREQRIHHLSRPSFDEIYLEIVKGFGVEFIEKSGQMCCRIKNKKMNDIYTIDISDDVPVSEICNSIWEKM